MKTPVCFGKLVEGHTFDWRKTFTQETVEGVSRTKVYCTAILDELSRHCDSGILFVPGVVVHNLGADFKVDLSFEVEYMFVLRLQTKIEFGHRKHTVFRVVVQDQKGNVCTFGQIGLYFP